MRKVCIGPDDPWPEGVSDGLALDCALCGRRPRVDYQVEDELWRRVVPEEARLGVVCLECFAELAEGKGVLDWPERVVRVQVCGSAQTLILKPEVVYDHRWK